MAKPTTKEYRAWSGIKIRCYRPKSIGYKYWGGRGILVCDRWLHSYENFLADMGLAPSEKHTLDRINNDGNYEPGNCRWATRKEQIHNRRCSRKLSINGETKTLLQWALLYNVDYNKVWRRYMRGWTENRIFS